MKALGKLSAQAIEVGDLISVRGLATKVVFVDNSGAVVRIETEMYESIAFARFEKISVLSSFN